MTHEQPAAGHSSRTRRLVKNAATYLGIVAATLLLFDLALIATGLFPPAHEYGVPDLGWVAAPPTGTMSENRCTEYASGRSVRYVRNEDAYRTSASAAALEGPGGVFEIAVAGDSHTDLCATNAEAHFGVTEREMSSAGVPTVTYAYGAGRYSPLQAYLAVRPALDDYEPDALILNLYTGNDFYDMLRVDDRPHFTRTEGGYRIADPVWYLYDAPGVERRSRVLSLFGSVAEASGISGILLRIRYLRAAAREQGQGMGAVVAYINDLRRSTTAEVGYPGAYAAQMLNQQLFFHRFPGARDESIHRVRELLHIIRRDHPHLILVLSPIPSYQLVGESPVDASLLEVLDRLPITHEQGIAEEETLYGLLEDEAAEAGWIFVDNLTSLRAYRGGERLYNGFDYHVEPVASDIIGKAQATAILPLAGAAATAPVAEPAYGTRSR